MTATATTTDVFSNWQPHSIDTLRAHARKLEDAIKRPDQQHGTIHEEVDAALLAIEQSFQELETLRLKRGQDDDDPAIGTDRYEPRGDERVELTEAGEALIEETGETAKADDTADPGAPGAPKAGCCGGGCGCKDETLTIESTDGPIGEGIKLPDTPGSTPGEPIVRKTIAVNPPTRDRLEQFQPCTGNLAVLEARWRHDSQPLSAHDLNLLVAESTYQIQCLRDDIASLKIKNASLLPAASENLKYFRLIQLISDACDLIDRIGGVGGAVEMQVQVIREIVVAQMVSVQRANIVASAEATGQKV